jgi:hypothetical protein
VIAVIDGRPSLVDEVQHVPNELRAYIAVEIRNLLRKSDFIDALPGYLLPDSASQARLGALLKTLQRITG